LDFNENPLVHLLPQALDPKCGLCNFFKPFMAFLTITAADGLDANHGLTKVSRPRSQQSHIRLGKCCLSSHLSVQKELEDSKWNTRGWTYQEGMLSQRRLIVTPSKAVFACQMMP